MNATEIPAMDKHPWKKNATFDEIIAMIEGEATPEDAYLTMQKLINSGDCWRLEGSVGRSAMRAIKEGRCMLGPVPNKDYWGNVVPARTQIKRGCVGSRSYVRRMHGEQWARKVAAV